MTEAPSDAIIDKIWPGCQCKNCRDATTIAALQARVKELEAECDILASSHRSIGKMLADEGRKCIRAEQQRDEAYERAAQVADQWLESSWADEVFAARSIAAAIRRLAAGTEKEGE